MTCYEGKIHIATAIIMVNLFFLKVEFI